MSRRRSAWRLAGAISVPGCICVLLTCSVNCKTPQVSAVLLCLARFHWRLHFYLGPPERGRIHWRNGCEQLCQSRFKEPDSSVSKSHPKFFAFAGARIIINSPSRACSFRFPGPASRDLQGESRAFLALNDGATGFNSLRDNLIGISDSTGALANLAIL